MRIRVESNQYTPSLLQTYSDEVFVFGDNMKRYGKGGQAIIRDEPNAFGVATKRYPSKDNWAYFSDQPDELNCVRNDLRRLYELSKTHTLVFPVDGIGTGLAMMGDCSPRIFEYMNSILLKHFSFKNGDLK